MFVIVKTETVASFIESDASSCIVQRLFRKISGSNILPCLIDHEHSRRPKLLTSSSGVKEGLSCCYILYDANCFFTQCCELCCVWSTRAFYRLRKFMDKEPFLIFRQCLCLE